MPDWAEVLERLGDQTGSHVHDLADAVRDAIDLAPQHLRPRQP